MNPIPYRVTAHGENLHLDQNEKVVMYGMTHVVAVDGYSRKIVGFITLPVKNAIVIYNCLFRPLLLKEGKWVQVRVDHGREFSLMLSVQQGLPGFHVRQDRVPFLPTVSQESHRVRGIPNHLRRNDHMLARIPSHAVPSKEHAVMQLNKMAAS